MDESRESQAPNRPSVRTRFFSGRLLTAADLEREQRYVREKLKRHNRTLHGFGIVSGLKVRMNAGQIVVEPGLALDCEGNEILIETPQSVAPPALSEATSAGATSSLADSSASSSSSDLPASVHRHTMYLNVRFVEDCIEPVSDTEGEAVNPTVLKESFELEVARDNCNRGHRHLRARWLACGQPHALTIAKLRRRSQGWTVDRGYRPPTVK